MSTEYLCQTFLKMRSTCNTRSSSSRFQLRLPKTWQKRSDLRWKQGPAEKVVGLHELKRSVWRNRLFLFNIFATENRIDYDSFTFQDPFQFKTFVTTNSGEDREIQPPCRFFSGTEGG